MLSDVIVPDVLFTNSIAHALKQYLAELSFTQLAVLVDENTREHCYPAVKEILPPHELVEITSGEEQKNLQTCTLIWDKLTNAAFDRKALVVNLGGGVITDMGGFCAATYKRGIRFINVPTTLLSQVDASVGGKLGIDFLGYKNHIGLFQEPEQVIVAPEFLHTLPYREKRSGFAEMLKHCLIADPEYLNQLCEKPLSKLDLSIHIPHSISIKYNIVQQDRREGGLRKILNFGHTIGHAIESYYLETDNKLLHGEAIAVGMMAELYLSHQLLGMNIEAYNQHLHRIRAYYNNVHTFHRHVPAVARLTLMDKKNEGGKVKAVLLEAPGKPVVDVELGYEEIEKALVVMVNEPPP